MHSSSDIVASLFHQWVINLALDLGRYVIAAGGLALILKLFWRAGLDRRKIQQRSPRADDVRREVVASLRTVLVFSLMGVLIYVGAVTGVFTIYLNFEAAGGGYLVLSLAAIIVAHDAYFYWTHRLMHHPRFFRWFHRTHHRSITPTPFAAYAFDLPEALVMAFFHSALAPRGSHARARTVLVLGVHDRTQRYGPCRGRADATRAR